MIPYEIRNLRGLKCTVLELKVSVTKLCFSLFTSDRYVTFRSLKTTNL